MNQAPLVMKFGGTSVGGGAQFVRAAGIVADGRSGVSGVAGHGRTAGVEARPAAVVVSAMSGTTDALIGLTATATTSGTTETTGSGITGGTRTSTTGTTGGATGEAAGGGFGSVTFAIEAGVAAILERHLAAARHALRESLLPEFEGRLRSLAAELELALLAADSMEDPFETLGGPDPWLAAFRDRVCGYGERLSATVLEGALRSTGTPARVVEDPIATDASHGEAGVDAAGTRRRAFREVRPVLESGAVAVVPGFVGRAPDGSVTTLGRGGSDLSATVLGRALGSREVWIFSDVDGVLDADPRLIPEAGLVHTLSYREAGAFARLGAKVLHPRTIEPAAAAGIEVVVRSTFNPESHGTRICAREGEPGLRCLGLRRGLALDSLFAAGCGDSEAAREIFCVLGADAERVRALVDEPEGGVSVVVGIGSPEDGDIIRGLRALEGAGIDPFWAGNTSAGLVFATADVVAEEAVRALHRELVRVELVEEVA